MDRKWGVGVCLAVVVIVLVAGTYVALKNRAQPIFDPLNATYTIDGQPVTLINGIAATENTMIFGQPTTGDLNNDGKPDAAIILVQDPGGSGTFYYVAAAINTTSGAQGTNAILLGDRIAPQNIHIQNGQIIANYADRKPGEPMSATPSVGVSMYLTYDGSVLKVSSQ